MPEWAERQLLHPEERRGREGKEGERGGREGGREEGWRPAGRSGEPRGLRPPQRRARGRPVTPPRPRSPRGKGVIAEGGVGCVGERDGTDTTDTGLGY